MYQPPGIQYAEVAHSGDLEVLEITAPAAFETAAVPAPAPLDPAATAG